MVVPFCGSYLGSYKVIPKRNYNGAYGYEVANTPQSLDQALSTLGRLRVLGLFGVAS